MKIAISYQLSTVSYQLPNHSSLLFCQPLGIRILTPLGVLPGAAVGLRG